MKQDDYYNIPAVVIEKLTEMSKKTEMLEERVCFLEQQNEMLVSDNDMLKSQMLGFSTEFTGLISQEEKFLLKSEVPTFEEQNQEYFIKNEILEETETFTQEFQKIYAILKEKPSKKAVKGALNTYQENLTDSLSKLEQNLCSILKEKADVDAVNEALQSKIDTVKLQDEMCEFQNEILAAIPEEIDQNILKDIDVRVKANTAKIVELEAEEQDFDQKRYNTLKEQISDLHTEIKQKADYTQLLQIQEIINELPFCDFENELRQRPTLSEVVKIMKEMK